MAVSIVRLIKIEIIGERTMSTRNYSVSGGTYETTFHEYVILQYDIRVDKRRIKDNLKDNESKWLINGQVDEYRYTRFIVDNLDLFTDERLFHQVLQEGRIIFNVEEGEPLYSPFSQEAKELLMDYDSSYGGLNLFKFDRLELLNDLQNRIISREMFSRFNAQEKQHFDALFQMFRQSSSIINIVDFLEATMNNDGFYPEYQSLLLTARNVSLFYDSREIDLPPSTLGTVTVYDIGGKIEGSKKFMIFFSKIKMTLEEFRKWTQTDQT
jgi:hypothetical protein